jgi:hypothetical protein
MLLFANDLLFTSIIGVLPFFILIMAVVGLFIIPWVLFSPILWTKRWFLRITQDGITDNAFGYKRVYPWTSIGRYEVKQTPANYTGRFKHQLILKLESKTVHIQLDNYGIDTESEISRFVSELDKMLLDN